MVFHVDDTGVYYQREITLFNNLAESAGINNRSIIFMGESTDSIGEAVFSEYDKAAGSVKKKIKTDSFSKAYNITTMPVHFIPIGDAGALMLKFKQIPDYREAFRVSF